MDLILLCLEHCGIGIIQWPHIAPGCALAVVSLAKECDESWSALLLVLFWGYYNQLVPTCVIYHHYHYFATN